MNDSPLLSTRCTLQQQETQRECERRRMGERAQSLADETTAALHQRKKPPTPSPVPPSAGAMTPPPHSLPGPPRPRMMQAPHMGGPPMMPAMGPPPPGIIPVGPAPGMRLPIEGHLSIMLGHPMMIPPVHPMMVPIQPRMTRQDR
ncbi:hypothetical protein P7K49_022943 [Saguinus oedipus]|uniref:Uncharacterized protein n=1 Tax=Saguinus oedipus TaxID=9490 RepID=A0ABQ9UMJ9_SAGOE|nr:hypothetical protein P7K49_022943 [Saguinus oedipus]